MSRKHREIERDGCMAIAVYGKNMKELFENAACGMFSLANQPHNYNKKDYMKVSVTAPCTEELLIAFLNKLRHYYAVRKYFLYSFKIMSLSDNKVHAKIIGEDISRREMPFVMLPAKRTVSGIKKTRTGYKTEIIFGN